MKKNFLFAATLLLSSFCISCGNDRPDPTPTPPDGENTEFVHSLNVLEDNVNTYVSLFKGLNVGEVNTDKALIHHHGAYTFVYKNKVYVTDTQHWYKYAVNGDELTQEGQTLEFPDRAFAVYITFVSDTKAYISCLGLGKLFIIDPSTMTKTGEIDLSQFAIGRESGDNDPCPGPSVIRDGILYVSLLQLKGGSLYNPHTGAHVALIDINTDKPIKAISDNRATMIAQSVPSGDPFIDENGDIYFYCVAAFGVSPSLKEGFLRIKKGEQDFDQSYYFPIGDKNIPDVKGNKASYIYTKVYAGKGKVYGFLVIPGLMNDPLQPDFSKDYNFQPFEINIYNNTLKKLNFDPTPGWAAAICKSGDDIVFGMATTTHGAGYYIYHTKDGSYENMKIKTGGAAPYAISPLK